MYSIVRRIKSIRVVDRLFLALIRKMRRSVLTFVVAILFLAINLISVPATARADVFDEVCTIVGTEFDDLLIGTTGDDVICGLGGNDNLSGLDGSDVIVGGTGNDVILGGNGNDQVSGGDGSDKITLGSGDDYSEGGPGADKLFGGNGKDAIIGGNGDDLLMGGADSDSLNGSGGVDYCDKDKKDSASLSCFFDSVGPKLVSIAISTKSINTREQSAIVIFRARVIDKGTGSKSASFSFRYKDNIESEYGLNFSIQSKVCEESQPQNPDISALITGCIVSGDEFDGVYEVRLFIPRFTPKGKYILFAAGGTDKAGNSAGMSLKDLSAKKLAVSYSQVGDGDTSKPKIVAVQMLTKSVNTNNDSRFVNFRVKVKDSGSGLAMLSGDFRSNDQNKLQTSYPFYIDFTNPDSLKCEGNSAADPSPGQAYNSCLSSGNENNATLDVKLRIPQYAPKSSYHLSTMWASDKVQNRVSILDVKPWNKIGFAQSGAGDSQEPVISEIKVLTPRVNTSSSDQATKIRVKFSDNMSGVGKLEILFQPINQANYMWFNFSASDQKCNEAGNAAEPGGSCLISGSLKSGVIEMNSSLPAHAPRTSFYLQQVSISDRADNGMGCVRDSCHESDVIKGFSVKNIQVKNTS